MTLEARRKNQGKQYSVVSTEDRVIRYWHRPGDHLPVMLAHAGQDYLLTREVIAEAFAKQRAKLVTLDRTEDGQFVIPTGSALQSTFSNPVAYPKETAKGVHHEIVSEINWKAVGVVVTALFAVAAFATFLTLGA